MGVIAFCMLYGFPPFYVDEENLKMGQSEEDAIFEAVGKGFTPEIKEGYGPWFCADIELSDECRDFLKLTLQKKIKVTYIYLCVFLKLLCMCAYRNV